MVEEESLDGLSDQSLLKRFRSGSADAATALYVRYAQRLEQLAGGKIDGRMAVRLDPESVVQSVFRTFFRRVTLGQYDVGDQGDLWKLLLVMALNKIRSGGEFHRAARRNVTRTESLADEVDPAGNDAGEPVAVTVLRLTIDELLDELPAGQREIVRLRIEGCEVGEIAEKTGRARRSVERILQGFRQQLQNQLG